MLFALLLLFSQPAYCENAGGVVGTSPTGFLQNTSEYVLETSTANCTFQIDRSINSSLTLSIMTTTLTNLGGSECALQDFLASDTIPSSFSELSNITFIPMYSLNSGSTIGFALPLFEGNSSASFIYTVHGWVAPARIKEFTKLLLSASRNNAGSAQTPPSQAAKPAVLPKAIQAPVASSAPAPAAVASIVVIPEQDAPQDQTPIATHVLRAIYAVSALLAITSATYLAVKNKGNNIWDDVERKTPQQNLGGQDRLPPLGPEGQMGGRTDGYY